MSRYRPDPQIRYRAPPRQLELPLDFEASERGARLRNLGSSKPRRSRLSPARVDASATIHADEASHWDRLHTKFLTKRINHEWAYSHEGACTNQAESYFSRLRRAEVGQHHHIAGTICKRTLARSLGARITAGCRTASNI